MKRIGFVDYYLGEWHANSYPGWIREINEVLGLDYQVAYAWAERDVSPVDGVTTDQWCAKMGVERCHSIQELCEKSDFIVVLAPSDPDTHLRYAQTVLPYGKRTYIDKTFAPNLETAKEIFAIAEKYNTPFFSSSALRFGDELMQIKDANNLVVMAGGRSMEEYIIHQIEMAVSLLKNPAKKVKVEHFGNQRVCSVVTENGSRAAMVYSQGLVYHVSAEMRSGEYFSQRISSPFFKNLIRNILTFFETGSIPFDVQETLEVMRLRDGILKADTLDGEWVEL